MSSPLSVHTKHCLKTSSLVTYGKFRRILLEKNRCLFPFSVANDLSHFPRDVSSLLSCGRTRKSSTNYLATNILFVFYLLLNKSSKDQQSSSV